MSQANSDGGEGTSEPSLPLNKTKKPPQKIRDCCSSLSREDVESLTEKFPCLAEYHPTVPDEHAKVYPPPLGKVAIYESYLKSSALRLPFTPFFIEVLSYYKLGLSQLHPFAAGKIVRFEMFSRALGQPLSLYLFREVFLLSRVGECFTFLYRDKKFKLIETPPKLSNWRFDYFFVGASFIPTRVRECLQLGKLDYSSAEISKINKKAADQLVNRRHYNKLLKSCIPYCSFPPPRCEGLLAMVGISPTWDWNTIPVLIKKSTREPARLMDGLKFNFDGYCVKKKSKESALKLREQANELISPYLENVNVEEGTMDVILHSDAPGTSMEQNDHHSSAANQDGSGTVYF